MFLTVFFILIHAFKSLQVHSFAPIASNLRSNRNWNLSAQERAIERQSDEKYGRGITHISADISEGEIIAYQAGSWYVDGIEVGE